MKVLFLYILLLIIFPNSAFSYSSIIGEENATKSDTIVYEIDIEKSRLDWYCDIHDGYIMLDSGYITIYNNEIIAGRFVICMESLIDLDIIDYELMRITFENTLKSIEFFNTAKFHHSVFEFDYVQKTNSGYNITGELELMSVVQCIDFDAEFEFSNDKLIATSDSITIDRTHWGITSMSKDDAKSDRSFIVPNEIGIVVHLVAYEYSNSQ